MRTTAGQEGYVAAWYVKITSGSAPSGTTTAPATKPAPADAELKVTTTAEGVALRSQPVVSDATLIKRLPAGTDLTVTEEGAEGKIGVTNQWLKVKDPTGSEGYVAAWFVER